MKKLRTAERITSNGYPIPMDLFASLVSEGIIVEEFTDSIDGYLDVDKLVDSMADLEDLTEI